MLVDILKDIKLESAISSKDKFILLIKDRLSKSLYIYESELDSIVSNYENNFNNRG